MKHLSITLPLNIDQIINLLSHLKEYNIDTVQIENNETYMHFTSFGQHVLKYNKKVKIIPNVLDVFKKDDNTFIRIKKVYEKKLEDYDLLMNKFIPETCPHLFSFLNDYPIDIVKYAIIVEMQNVEPIISIQYKFNKLNTLNNIPEYLDNSFVLACLVSYFHNFKPDKPINNYIEIDLEKIEKYLNLNVSFFDSLKKFFSQLEFSISDIVELNKNGYNINFFKVPLFETKTLGVYEHLKDLQYLNFVNDSIGVVNGKNSSNLL